MDKKMAIAAPVALLTVGLVSTIGIAVSQNMARAEAEEALTAVADQTAELQQQLDKYKGELAEMRLSSTRVTPVEITDANPQLQAMIESQREEIARLKAQLAADGEATEEQRREARVAEFESRRQEREERMQQWQQENPEEYARMQEEREQRIQDMRTRAKDRIEFLASVNTEGLSPEYAQNHEQLVDKLQFMNRAMNAIMQDPESESSRELRGQMREGFREMGEMMEMEKEVLLADLASNLGYEADESQDFIEYVDYINEVTSMRGVVGGRGFTGGGDRGGDRGGRGGGGGGGGR